jgi:hypothetical protein
MGVYSNHERGRVARAWVGGRARVRARARWRAGFLYHRVAVETVN